MALRDIRVASGTLRPGDLLCSSGNWKNKGVSPQLAETQADAERTEYASAAYARYQAQLRAGRSDGFR